MLLLASPVRAAGELPRGDDPQVEPQAEPMAGEGHVCEHEDCPHHGHEEQACEHEDCPHHGEAMHAEPRDGRVEMRSGRSSAHGGHGSRFPDEAIPLQLDAVPRRPRPLLELGEPYLGTGTLNPGIELPTGAVWQPQLLAFGTFRTAIQSFESDAFDNARITEWTNRLDLFFNLQLSGTERLVVGLRTLDTDGRFTSYFFEHPDDTREGELEDELDADLEVLFFEGDFGEIFPNLDAKDFKSLDIGFSAGRQPMLFQEGLLIDDTIDGIGLTRNTLQPAAAANFRMTLFYGWDNINLDNGTRRDANLFALLTSTDFRKSTMDLDLAYVQAHGNDPYGDLLAGGVSFVQRFGKVASSLRFLGSHAVDDQTAASTDGLLLFSEWSWIPPHTHDHVYATTFWAIDRYSPAARGSGPASSGPLGRAGINFAAVGLGSYGAPLSAQARDVAGGAVGYQKFLAGDRRQVIVEAAARFGTDSAVDDSFATTVRFQSAIGHHLVLVVDGFLGYQDAQDRVPYGGRLELLTKF